MKNIYNMLFMFSLFAGLSEMPNQYYNPYYEDKPKKKRNLVKSFGSGKRKFVFETKHGEVEIWADNEKSANKKLKTLNGLNEEIENYNRNIK